ncbi:hypothetical protein D3C71_523130 [compost metagenome]
MTAKNPSPSIRRSSGLFVVIALPPVCRVSTEPIEVPKPICFELTPPLVPSTGVVTPDTVWLIISLNMTRPDLKPTVLTLAMLLPITSSLVWKPRIPDTPEYMDLNIEKIPPLVLNLVSCFSRSAAELGFRIRASQETLLLNDYCTINLSEDIVMHTAAIHCGDYSSVIYIDNERHVFH